ncbi:MAG: methyltransferase domain-containing protein [Victivallales bacterium]|nr:methyltransferase domain-containing protein [Victivallales bacterium]
MLEYADIHGWEAAADIVPEINDWVSSRNRHNGLFLANLDDNSVVLDYGCGFGSLSLAAANMAKEVVALDANDPYIRGVSIRARDGRIGNIFPILTDFYNMPFIEDTFDLIIINGVLEYIPCYRPDQRPEQTIEDFLSALTKVLKPGGQIYLGIENRFGINYLLGAIDEHSGLRFSSLLPRKLANVYSKIKRGTPYKEWTHSYGELISMFKRHGYNQGTMFAAFPDYRFPSHLIQLDLPGAMTYFIRQYTLAEGSFRRRIALFCAKVAAILGLTKLPIIKKLVPCFVGIFRKKGSESQSSPRWLCNEDASLTSERKAGIYLRRGHWALSALLFKQNKAKPYSTIRFAEKNNSVEKETQILAYLMTSTVNNWLMKPVATTSFANWSARKYTWICHPKKIPQDEVEQFLQALSRIKLPEMLNNDEHDRFIFTALSEIPSCGKNCAEWYENWYKSRADDDAMKIVHGDLHPGNILTDGKTILIIDWEVTHRGSPFEDILHWELWKRKVLPSESIIISYIEMKVKENLDAVSQYSMIRDDVTAGMLAECLRLWRLRRLSAQSIANLVKEYI